MVHYTLALTLLWRLATQTSVVSLPYKVSLTLEFGIFTMMYIVSTYFYLS